MEFKDINTGYGQNTLPFVLTDGQALQNKLMNLLTCQYGTRFRRPTFGTRLFMMVHEPCDGSTAHDILYELLNAISTWMKGEIEVVLNQSMVLPLPTSNGFYVKITYYAPLLQQQASVSFAATRS